MSCWSQRIYGSAVRGDIVLDIAVAGGGDNVGLGILGTGMKSLFVDTVSPRYAPHQKGEADFCGLQKDPMAVSGSMHRYYCAEEVVALVFCEGRPFLETLDGDADLRNTSWLTEVAAWML